MIHNGLDELHDFSGVGFETFFREQTREERFFLLVPLGDRFAVLQNGLVVFAQDGFGLAFDAVGIVQALDGGHDDLACFVLFLVATVQDDVAQFAEVNVVEMILDRVREATPSGLCE